MTRRQRIHRITILSTVFFALAVSIGAQELETATQFFDALAQRYTGIVDYSADIRMIREEASYAGEIFYRGPNQIRINFNEPEDQVLVSDGRVLKVYIPEYNVVLQQTLAEGGDGSGAALATEEGLELMKEGYSIAYLDSPDPVALEEGSDEMVTKLRLDWRVSSEGFRQLTLSITDDLLIRRIEAVTVGYEEIVFDFTDIVLNEGIPTTRFEYEAPASANIYTDFLFEGN
ncbi:MAG: outer membrane lipoprotein carrier protein LolA [Spirochaetes bacterium]|nr:outer membrane lipoprotein carrier protein LolA [Spirochaetota bacterium]